VFTAEPDTYAIGGKRLRWVVPIDGSWWGMEVTSVRTGRSRPVS
jgi:hypothetical protein